jgi:hypothetical protein
MSARCNRPGVHSPRLFFFLAHAYLAVTPYRHHYAFCCFVACRVRSCLLYSRAAASVCCKYQEKKPFSKPCLVWPHLLVPPAIAFCCRYNRRKKSKKKADSDDDGAVDQAEDADDEETLNFLNACSISERVRRDDGHGYAASSSEEESDHTDDDSGDDEAVDHVSAESVDAGVAFGDGAPIGSAPVGGAGAAAAPGPPREAYVAQWYTAVNDTVGPAAFTKVKPCDKMDWEPALAGPITTNPESTIYDHFEAIFTEAVVLKEVATHTNDEGIRRYAQPAPPARPIPGRRRWAPIGPGTLLLHIALLIMMGVNSMPSPHHHWSHIYAGTNQHCALLLSSHSARACCGCYS